MRSHFYKLSVGQWLKVVSGPALGAATLALVLHAAHGMGLLPKPKRIDNPDETLLSFKAQLSSSRHPADIVLLGDSSCATGVEAPQLGALLPGHPRVLNLGLMIGLGLDVYGEVLSSFLENNPGCTKWVVLLVTPQLLSNESLDPGAQAAWRQAQRPVSEVEPSNAGIVSRLFAVHLLKNGLYRQLLHTPARIGSLYAFSSDFADYLARHEGSMIDPSTFHPPPHPMPAHYSLAPSLKAISERFRNRLPSGTKLAVGLAPIPESLSSPTYLNQRDQLLRGWNDWLHADYLLTNAPAQMGDVFFATGNHLNRVGQNRFTHKVASILAAHINAKN